MSMRCESSCTVTPVRSIAATWTPCAVSITRMPKTATGSFSSWLLVDTFLRTLAETRPYIRSMQHHITTTNFAICGDIAEGEIYSIATHLFAANGGETEVVVGGRYLDKYEKRDGHMEIHHAMHYHRLGACQ